MNLQALNILNFHRQWGKATFNYLRSLVDTEDAYKYQVHYITAYDLWDRPLEKSPLSKIFLYHERLSREDLEKTFPPDIM